MLRYPLTLMLLVLLLGGALAQDVRRALPADSLLVLGVQDLADVWDELEDFRSEFERLGVGEALAQFLADDELELDGLFDGVDIDIDTLDLLGREAWLSVSASPFSPLPAVTLLARVDAETGVAVARLIGESAAQADVTGLREGDYDFYVMELDAESPLPVLAYGQSGELLYLSSNPDTLRGVLRRLDGADEPGFESQPLDRLGEGNVYSHLDYEALAGVVQPFAGGLGFDRAVRRLGEAFTTAGATASVFRVTPEGFESEGFGAVNPQGGDDRLLGLLTAEGTAADALAFAPAGTIAYSSSYTDLGGWWDYLNELSRSVPELGDLNSLLASFTGIDVGERVFSWMGNQVITITTGFGDPTPPGVPSANLLGDQVFMIAADDEEAARASLGELFETVATTLAAFTDPMGRAMPESSTREVGGVTVTDYGISEGINVAYAVTEGLALLALSSEAMEDVLEARATGASLAGREDVTALLATVPADASHVSYTDNAANVAFLANQISSQLQLGVGLMGGADIDFEAVIEASARVETFLQFVASRLGPGVGYSQRSQEGGYSYGFTPVDW
jgi:hypothetical protein